MSHLISSHCLNFVVSTRKVLLVINLVSLYHDDLVYEYTLEKGTEARYLHTTSLTTYSTYIIQYVISLQFKKDFARQKSDHDVKPFII